MDPSVPAEVGGQAKERKKIHFSVPATPTPPLDPRQVEMIRRRRPTPATLFRVTEQPSPDDELTTHQWVVGENGVLKPKRVVPGVYQPPSLKAVQRMAQAHMQNLGICPPLEDPSEGDESEDRLWLGEEGDERQEVLVQVPERQAETGSSDSQSEWQLRPGIAAELGDGTKRGDDGAEDEDEEGDGEQEEDRRGRGTD
ncbi:protein phosphatase 1 regulatory subunit 1B [Brienomyrus brachyistius]|uniref:protein phosphatase 1 regulatory subunit 1B n=1 Tax=Brienomyrus brachyistius TaxID=42636 RepID=UPI0020B18C82|nr:protein phosphatase 1 regulatory subunit 1B [Brienomyrus brachyistius]